MFGLIKAKDAAADQAQAVRAARSSDANTFAKRLADQRSQTADARTALIETLTTHYYAAAALAPGNTFQQGASHGLVEALAAATGINSIVMSFRLDHGIPPEANWLTVVDRGPEGQDLHVLLHDDVREPIEPRLNRLKAEALRATGHPLAGVFAREAGLSVTV